MKKTSVVIAVLLLLAAVVGFDGLPSLLRLVIRDDRVERMGVMEDRGAEPAGDDEMASDSPRRLESIATAIPSSGDDLARSSPVDGVGDPGVGADTQLLSITGTVSNFHFIRSSGIVGVSVSSEAQMARLKEASGMVLGSLGAGTIIFDADVRGARGFPVMLFGHDGLDLTTQVKQVYDALGGGPVEVAGGGSGGADEP